VATVANFSAEKPSENDDFIGSYKNKHWIWIKQSK